MKYSLLVLAIAWVPSIGCEHGEPAEPAEDDGALSSELATNAEYDNWTYFIVTRQDLRKCMAPLCGGVYVRRVNQPKIKCDDGTWQSECYVGGFDFAALGYSEEEQGDALAAISTQRAVFRGKLAADYYEGFSVAAFSLSEVWIAATDKMPTGSFYRAEDSGIVCFTYPCPVVQGVKLNKNANVSAFYSGLDLYPSGATEDQISAAWGELASSAVLVAGKTMTVEGPAGEATGITASQFYTQKTASSVSEQACGSKGLLPCPEGTFCEWDDAMCGAADRPGHCVPQPEVCTKEYVPVCGCDGVTYGNDCERQVAGAGFGTPGECPSSDCQVSGCSGELCVSAGQEPSASICTCLPEYACYQAVGSCEVQADGQCGWTQSSDLSTCLQNLSN